MDRALRDVAVAGMTAVTFQRARTPGHDLHPMTAPDSHVTAMTVLRHRDFRLYAIARLTSTLGRQMLGVCVGWQVYRITGDPLDLGLVGLVQFLPILCLGLLGGHVADHRERVRTLVWCLYISTAVTAGLMLYALGGAPKVWPVLLLLTIHACGVAFYQPASQALLRHLVPKEHVPNAIAVNTTVWHTASVAGPALGGMALVGGEVWAYGLAAALLLSAAILMARVPPRPVPAHMGSFNWLAITGGLRYVWRNKIILGAISLDLVAVLLGGVTALLPIFASDILGVGPSGYGWLRAAPAVGAIGIGLYLTRWPLRRRTGTAMFAGVAGYGLATLVFGLSTWFWLSFVMLALAGAADMMSVFVRHNLVQLATPDVMRGRVGAVSSVFISASNELGEFESGAVAAWIGIIPCVVVGAAGTVLATALWIKLFPELYRVDRPEDAENLGEESLEARP
jgi:MFS family permease